MNARLSSFFLVATLGGFAGAADAAVVTYTDSTSFLAAVQADYYLENFQSLTLYETPASLNFGPTNGYAYTASVIPTGVRKLYVPDVGGGNLALSTDTTTVDLKLDFTGKAVTALGGFFFAVDVLDAPASEPIVFTFVFSDTTTETWTSNAVTLSDFLGFTSSVAITSLTVDAPSFNGTDGRWPTIDDLYVGAAGTSNVPAPATALLLGAGLLGFGAGRRHRAAA